MLFLDVDGPLIPFGAPDGRYPAHLPPGAAGANPLLARIDPALGPLLAALPCELVWATTWMHEANRSVGPVLGLPPAAVLDRPDSSRLRHLYARRRRSSAAAVRAGNNVRTARNNATGCYQIGERGQRMPFPFTPYLLEREVWDHNDLGTVLQHMLYRDEYPEPRSCVGDHGVHDLEGVRPDDPFEFGAVVIGPAQHNRPSAGGSPVGHGRALTVYSSAAS